MKQLITGILIIFFGVAAGAQQPISDPLVQQREVGHFHAVEVSSGIKLFLSAGTTDEVAVSASTEAYRDRIVSRVENGVLKLYFDNKLKAGTRKKVHAELKAYVSCSALSELHATTGALVKLQGVFTGTTLTMKANTGAQINGEVAFTSLDIKQNTGSLIILTGKSDKLKVEGDTGSKFKGEGIQASVCNVDVGTGAVVEVTAAKELAVKAGTGGVVRYAGNPAVTELKTGTGGSVKRI